MTATPLIRLADAIDTLNEGIGRGVRWVTLGTVAVCFLVATMRYLFAFGYVWIQELYVWQHAAVFMLGSAYTLKHEGHVRVDLLYARRSPHGRAWTDILGTLFFLFPWLALIAVTSLPFVRLSWAVGESSPQYGGLPAVYLLKSLILVFTALLFLQGLATLIRRALFLLGYEPGGTGATTTPGV